MVDCVTETTDSKAVVKKVTTALKNSSSSISCGFPLPLDFQVGKCDHMSYYNFPPEPIRRIIAGAMQCAIIQRYL